MSLVYTGARNKDLRMGNGHGAAKHQLLIAIPRTILGIAKLHETHSEQTMFKPKVHAPFAICVGGKYTRHIISKDRNWRGNICLTGIYSSINKDKIEYIYD